MCCCGTPTINGQPTYRWQPNDKPSVRPVDPPTVNDGEVLIFDEPGRCGGLDCHSHHFRVVTWYSSWYLLVRHGGGDERIELFHRKVLGPVLDTLDSTARYWMLHAIYSAHSDGGKKARDKESHYWRTAAAEKRIKVRKIRGRDAMRVEVSA